MPSEGAAEPGGRSAPDILATPAAGPAAVRGGGARVVGYAVGVLITVVSAAVLFRHLGVVDSGRYVTVLSLVVIATGLVDFGLTAIGVRELAVRPPDEGRRFVRNLIGMRLALTSVGVAGAVAFAAAAGYGPAMVAGTALAGVGLLGAAFQNTLAANLMVNLRFGWLTAIELIRQIVVATGIVAIVALGGGLLPLLATTIPAGVVVVAITVALVRTEMPLLPAADLGEWRRILRQMIPFAAATALAAIYFRVAVLLVSLLGSGQETGYFGASFRVIEVLLIIPNLIVSAAFPIFARAARDDHARLAYGVERVFEVSMLVGGWITATLIAGAPFVIEVVAGPGFGPAADVLRIQAVGFFITCVGASFFYAFLTLDRQRALLTLTGSAFLLNAALVSWLVSAYGIEAAAAGMVAAELVLSISGALYFAHLVPAMRLLTPVTVRVVAVTVACSALALIPGVPAVVLACGCALAFPVLAVAVGAVSEEVLVEVRRLAGSLGMRRPAGTG